MMDQLYTAVHVGSMVLFGSNSRQVQLSAAILVKKAEMSSAQIHKELL